MNNYERIKNMSIEEMEKFILSLIECYESPCHKCFNRKMCEDFAPGGTKGWLNYVIK